MVLTSRRNPRHVAVRLGSSLARLAGTGETVKKGRLRTEFASPSATRIDGIVFKRKSQSVPGESVCNPWRFPSG